MADFYKRRDVQALLKHKKVLFLGDSNVRPLYKDLINAIKYKELINVDILKNPNVDSYCGDIAIQQCGRKHEWTFWENRLFEEGPWRVEMFCTGGVMIREIQQYIFTLPEIPSSMPDIVYISYNFSYGKNKRNLVSALLVHIKKQLPCNTLILVGSSFPTTRDMFGDPRFDEVPFFSMGTHSRDSGTDEDILGKVSSLGFHYLNIAHYLRRNVFRGVTTEPGWESVIVRYTTLLLLTYIGKSLMIKTPNRVNQDVLHKAMSLSSDERELYNSLLLKHADDWHGVKTNALSEEIDLAASNAHEITQMLWKVYHRSRLHSFMKGKPAGKSKSNHGRERRDKGKSISALTPGSSRGNVCELKSRKTETSLVASASSYVSPKGADIPRKTIEQQANDAEKQDYAHENLLTAPLGKINAMKTSSHKEILSSLTMGSISKGDESTYDEMQDGKRIHDDEESLEEGEIRESPGRSPKWQGFHIDSNITVLSDISSSDGEVGAPGIERVVLPAVPTYHQYYQHHPSLINGYQSYHAQNYQVQFPTYNRAAPPPEHIQCTDFTYSGLVVDVSDEEPTQEEKPNDDCNVAYEAIINLNSEGSEDDLSYHNETIAPLQGSSWHEKSKSRQYKCGGKAKLCLWNEQGTLISWPTGIARSGPEILWKWWRTHIEGNNGSLVLYHPGMDHIYGVIPSYCAKKGTCIGVPKIVDDMHQFLKCLGETKFPDYCTDLNVRGRGAQTFHNMKKKAVKPMKLLPLAEELTRGSVKRIHFEIKKKSSSLSASNRITIKEFASIRHLVTKNTKKSDLETSCESKASTSSTFYSYGEHPTTVPSSDKSHGSPRRTRVTNSNIDSNKVEGKSTRRSSHDKARNDRSHWGKKNTLKSANSYETKKNSSKETFSKRWRHRSSSSSDQSPPNRDRSPSQRHRQRSPSSVERSWYRDSSPSRYHRHEHRSSSDKVDFKAQALQERD